MRFLNAQLGILRLVILLSSGAASLLFCELGARIVLNPADYLSPQVSRHEILGFAVAPKSGGFDAWGFRNRGVPASVDVVAIGDSHTYGNNATMTESWPYVAGALTGLSVYSLSLGGYGPNQYYHLLLTRGLKLKPRWVFCGLYVGDDFQNAFSTTYGLEYWASLRQGTWGSVDPDIWDPPGTYSWHKPIRMWLSSHSIGYRLLFHASPLGALKGAAQIRRAAHSQDSDVTTLTNRDSGIDEAFRPVNIRHNLDTSAPAIREGMRITLALISRMNDSVRNAGGRFVVVIIPTKEAVFADYFAHDSGLHLGKQIEDVIALDAAATSTVVTFLNHSGIPYVETLPRLREGVATHLYVRSEADMHPSRNGYRLIGEAVADFIRKSDLHKMVHRPAR